MANTLQIFEESFFIYFNDLTKKKIVLKPYNQTYYVWLGRFKDFFFNIFFFLVNKIT